MSSLTISFHGLKEEEQAFAGGKGGSLARLYQAGYPVPDGFVILPGSFVDDHLQPEAWAEVQARLAQLREADPEVAFAVRSSARSEDSAQASFAGEFETVLNVQTDDEVRRAIDTVYHSRQSERVKAYSQAKGIDAEHQIAIIIQKLVKADRSGVLFTANPITGQRDQAVINAAWGLGEAIVGGLVTPDTIIVDEASGRVLTRETADKQVMTVLLDSHTEACPVPEGKRRAPVLSDGEAVELVKLALQIEELYGTPMDIEWVMADGEVQIVQARPVTALPEPEPAPPTVWKLPEGNYVAMRNNIVELMADPLTPLFDTLGREAINTSMGNLLSSFFGRHDIMPGELIISVNAYAYYNGSMSPGQIVRILLSSVGIMRHMFTGAVERWTETGRPQYVETVARWRVVPWREFSATDLLNAARALAEAAIDAYGAMVSGVIPAAWISEALFTIGYNTLIKRRDDPLAPIYLLGFDSLPIRAEKSLYDLAKWARAREELATYLLDMPAAQLVAQLDTDQTPLGVAAGDWRAWQERLQAHLDRYGHTIYNLDFANPVPADDPAPVLETCELFIAGQGVDPHTRQKAAIERREQAVRAVRQRLGGLRLKLFNKLLGTAQRYAPLREDSLADVGLGYPLLRQMLRELGRRFVEGSLIESPDDIFWLRHEEVKEAAGRLDRGEPLRNLSPAIPPRQAKWRSSRKVAPPLMLPQIKLFGVDITELRSGRWKGRAEDTLKGVAGSPGRVTAPACVLHGPEDFAQMKVGDVLVTAITTPAWTPLFARAAAIVTDVGGPLSHGSIVAREYGIPAVLGTDSATARIRSGQVITVDGSAGVVDLSAG